MKNTGSVGLTETEKWTACAILSVIVFIIFGSHMMYHKPEDTSHGNGQLLTIFSAIATIAISIKLFLVVRHSNKEIEKLDALQRQQ